MKRCLFCGGKATTKEDFFPKWLKRDFSLYNELLYLPNDTLAAYKDLVVPACRLDQARASKLETRVSRGWATPDDIYVWAFKIHAGFAYFYLRLRDDVSKPLGDPIPVLGLTGASLVDYYLGQLRNFQSLFRVWRQTDYAFHPSPPGSVFQLPALGSHFDFTHRPNGFVGIRVGTQYYMVCVYDGGIGQQIFDPALWTRERAEQRLQYVTGDDLPTRKEGCYRAYQRERLLHLAYATLRLPRPTAVWEPKTLTVNIPAPPIMVLPPEDPEVLRVLARQFGFFQLTLENGDARFKLNPDVRRRSSMEAAT